MKLVVSKSDRSGIVSNGGRYVVVAEPEPEPELTMLLVEERIVRIESVGDIVIERSGGATARSSASLRLTLLERLVAERNVHSPNCINLLNALPCALCTGTFDSITI